MLPFAKGARSAARRCRVVPASMSESLEARLCLSAALVKDVNVTPAGSDPTGLTAVGDRVFFAATNPATGTELWKTDGTAGGTAMVKDLVPGPGASNPRLLTAVGDRLFFFSADRLWTSDGTEAGTVPVRAFNSPSPFLTAAVGNVLYFRLTESGVTRLWRSDGTSTGTFSLPAGGSTLTDMEAVGGTLFFNSSDSTGIELWKTDGSAAGTVRVKDVNPGTAGSLPQSLTAVGDTLFFTAEGAGSGRELWKSDGTAGGTVLVKDVVPGTTGSSPAGLVNAGGTLFFAATDLPGGTELWRSDGTEAGTVRVADLRPGAGGSTPAGLTAVGNRVYFAAAATEDDAELWSTDGTPEGTVLVKDVVPGPMASSPAELTNVGGRLFFTAAGADGLRRLWVSDTEDTLPVGGGDGAASPRGLAAAGGKVFFAASGPGGEEPWVSDGTTAGTFELSDVAPGTAGSSPQNITRVGGTTFFTVTIPDRRHELWKSDGTEAGTTRVKTFETGVFTRQRPLTRLTDVNGTLFFSADDGVNGTHLWRSDGTEAGTRRVAPAPAMGRVVPSPTELTNVNGALYFSGYDANFYRTLWKSDGTEAGTVMVNPSGLTDLRPQHLAAVGDVLYYSGDSVGAGNELWRSDGTPGGTFRVKDIDAGTSGSDPRDLAEVNGALYFTAEPGDGSAVRALFRSDGTEAGTVRATNQRDEYVWAFAGLGDAVLFVGQGGWLWRTDGTPAGTSRLVQVSSAWDSPIEMHSAGGLMYVAMHRGPRTSLWRSDGTAAGSYLLRQFDNVDLGSAVRRAELTEAGGRLFFSASDGPGSRELWASDGTVAGTARAEDVYPGPVGSDPTSLTAGGGALWFAGEWPNVGRELLRLPVPAVVGRHVFYNRSTLDGHDASANAADDGAIAAGKVPLLPGQAASFLNVTSYTKGINGIMIDVAGGLPLTALAGIAASLELKAGAGGDPAGWPDGPRPAQVAIRAGAGVGGSDRITLAWPDGAVRNTWLRVTVRALPQSGLAADDVFTFGNLVGETGDAATVLGVGTGDVLDTRSRRATGAATINNVYDHNRDGSVNVLDYAAAASNVGRSLTPTPPAAVLTYAGSYSLRPRAQPTRRMVLAAAAPRHLWSSGVAQAEQEVPAVRDDAPLRI